jgi:Flp pilus assembly pilin Flp
MKTMAIKLVTAVQSRLHDDEGAVSAEYGVLLAGVVAVVAIAATALGGRITGIFDAVLP